jgi:hypothetical protein
VLHSRGDPDRLLRWQQIAGSVRLDFGDALKGVFKLVKVV